MRTILRSSFHLLLQVGLLLGLARSSAAQLEVEPNEFCASPQIVVLNGGALSIQGSIDTPPFDPDVDFFMFAATPGSFLTVDLQSVSGLDPLLGFFDSSCNLLQVNDDFNGRSSHLEIFVPADGIVVLAAAAFADFGFTGSGGSSGAYLLTAVPPPPSIGSIAGGLVDAVTGTPLPGTEQPFGMAQLLRCDAA
jgi:hypothetical protein